MTYPTYMTPDELERRAYVGNDTLLASLFAICSDQEKQIDLL